MGNAEWLKKLLEFKNQSKEKRKNMKRGGGEQQKKQKDPRRRSRPCKSKNKDLTTSTGMYGRVVLVWYARRTLTD